MPNSITGSRLRPQAPSWPLPPSSPSPPPSLMGTLYSPPVSPPPGYYSSAASTGVRGAMMTNVCHWAHPRGTPTSSPTKLTFGTLSLAYGTVTPPASSTPSSGGMSPGRAATHAALAAKIVGDKTAGERFAEDLVRGRWAAEWALWAWVREVTMLTHHWLGYKTHDPTSLAALRRARAAAAAAVDAHTAVPAFAAAPAGGPAPDQEPTLQPLGISRTEFLNFISTHRMAPHVSSFVRAYPPRLLPPGPQPTQHQYTRQTKVTATVHPGHLLTLLRMPVGDLNGHVHDITLGQAACVLRKLEAMSGHDLVVCGVWGKEMRLAMQCRDTLCAVIRQWLGLYPQEPVPDWLCAAPSSTPTAPTAINQAAGNTQQGRQGGDAFERRLKPRVEDLANLPWAQASGLYAELDVWATELGKQKRRNQQEVLRKEGWTVFKDDFDEFGQKINADLEQNADEIKGLLTQTTDDIKADLAQEKAKFERKLAAYDKAFQKLGIDTLNFV
ncbi:hypothetical protein DFH27DRAFT_527995 [Peziza echinospora]|nr:hypothetical protein DFH27DRAFT_527995 [Peziza echinospora]